MDQHKNDSGISLSPESCAPQPAMATPMGPLLLPAQPSSRQEAVEASSSQGLGENVGIDEPWNVDYDSDDSAVTSTTSVDHSVLDHFYENGRRYHRFREGLYPFPNDAMEQEREKMLHALTVSLCGGMSHMAPIGTNPQCIMDLGTGTGTWAIESECYNMMLVRVYEFSSLPRVMDSGRQVSQC